MARMRRRRVTIRNGSSARRGVQRRLHPKNERDRTWLRFATGWLFGGRRIRKRNGRKGWWAS